jgi:hypothetical protein
MSSRSCESASTCRQPLKRASSHGKRQADLQAASCPCATLAPPGRVGPACASIHPTRPSTPASGRSPSSVTVPSRTESFQRQQKLARVDTSWLPSYHTDRRSGVSVPPRNDRCAGYPAPLTATVFRFLVLSLMGPTMRTATVQSFRATRLLNSALEERRPGALDAARPPAPSHQDRAWELRLPQRELDRRVCGLLTVYRPASGRAVRWLTAAV